jgi:putative endonuclease
MADTRKERGRLAEDAAAGYLEAHGFTILERNYRKRRGEIDIIARKGDRLHFCEVKSIWSDTGPSPMEIWDATQRGRFTGIAEVYLSENPDLTRMDDVEISFDFITVLFDDKGEVMELDIMEDAFRPD